MTVDGSTIGGILLDAGGRSGVISIQTDKEVSLTGVTLSGGTSHLGSGIYNSGTLTLKNSTISGNNTSRHASFDSGGGIYNSGTLTLTNSTVSGNSTTFSGGGIRNWGKLILTNTIVSGNSAVGSGGGISNSASLTLYNTVVALNKVLGINSSDIDGRVESSSSHNFIGAASGVSGISDGENGNIVGRGDPGLFVLASDGNLGYYPILGSPLVDAGDSSQATEGTDMLGNPRVQGGSVDIGAIEGVYDFPISLAFVSPAKGATLLASRSEPIVIDTAAPASATFTVFLDADGVIDGDEKWLYQDAPIGAIGSLNWKSAWHPEGAYLLTVILDDKSFTNPVTDQSQITIKHPN